MSFSSSDFKVFKASTYSINLFIPWSSVIFICFSNALPSGKYVNLACSIILLWSDGNISSLVRNLYLSILPDDNTDTFPAFLSISHCSFSSLILSSIVVISFYIRSKRFYLKHEELSDTRIVSITKKNVVLQYIFVKIYKVLKVNIWWMIKFDLLRLSFFFNFITK